MKKNQKKSKKSKSTQEIRLNRYLSMAGVTSRRKADKYIEAGRVQVNGEVITQMGFKVTRQDTVKVDGEIITPEKEVYILLNKPGGTLSTTDDPEGRPTVMDLLKGVKQEGLFPVGRLDMDTTGLMIITNDGKLAQKLAHPKFEVNKIYRARLDRSLSQRHFNMIRQGLELKDGPVQVDKIQYVGNNKKKVEITIHMGRKRIVRRLFETLGYKVKHLDRCGYGYFRHRNLKRGQWRYLSESEVRRLEKIADSS